MHVLFRIDTRIVGDGRSAIGFVQVAGWCTTSTQFPVQQNREATAFYIILYAMCFYCVYFSVIFPVVTCLCGVRNLVLHRV